MSKWRVLVIDNIAVESSRRLVYRVLANRFDCEVHLVVPRVWKEQCEEIEYENHRDNYMYVHPVKFSLGFRAHRVLYRGLGKILRDLKPDFLYIDTEPENYAAVEAIVLTSVYSPSTKLGLVSSRNIDYLKRGFPYRFAITHRICDFIIRKKPFDVCFYRPRSAPLFLAHYAHRLSYLPWAVDCGTFKKDRFISEHARQGNIVIGYVGRLVKEKGIDNLVDSLVMLPENVRLLIVGNGPMLNKLQQQVVTLNVGHRVGFEKAVLYEKIPKILNGIDILVLPSLETRFWKEQFGRILIEAMACETAIVASDSGEIPEVIGEAGLLFPQGNVDQLGVTLKRLIDDNKLRLDLAKKGRNRALTRYDVPIVADYMYDGIRSVLAN